MQKVLAKVRVESV